MKEDIQTFEQVVKLAREKWKAAEGTTVDGNDTWVNIGDHHDLNLFVDIEDPDKKVQAHLYEVFDGHTDTHRWFILCDDERDDHWIDAAPTLYVMTHAYGNGVTAYQFHSYKTYGGWYGPDGDEPPKEVLEARGSAAPRAKPKTWRKPGSGRTRVHSHWGSARITRTRSPCGCQWRLVNCNPNPNTRR